MIDNRKRLCAALEEFEKTLRQSAGLAKDNFEGRKKEAIELRRKIAEHRNTISKLSEASFSDAGLQSAFRSQFSRLCAAIAFHQASWPVVSIDLTSLEYSASIAVVRSAYFDFFLWARKTLASC